MSIREATVSGGALDSLGQGKVRISAKDRKHLNRVHNALSILAFMVLTGFFMLTYLFRSDFQPDVTVMAPFPQKLTFPAYSLM